MKGGGKIYPNIGVKIDPRAITSARMPESLKVYCGYLANGFIFLMGEGILKRIDVRREEQKIRDLLPFSLSKNKLASSYWFYSDTHLVEFLRTSTYNYKVYALQMTFLKGSLSLFPI